MTQSRHRSAGAVALGHDAFLDIVANLVGILIILVVILGSTTREVVEAIKEKSPIDPQAASSDLVTDQPLTVEAVQQRYEDLETESQRAVEALADSQRLEREIRRSDAQLGEIARQRGQLMDLINMAKLAWEDKKKELDSKDVQRGQAEAKIAAAQKELEDLQQARSRVENAERPVVAVSHLPTPMAKTVFGEELHFRLKGGRLAIVPIDRLLAEIQRDLQRSVSGGRDGVIDSAVGPVQGFVARYEMEKSREMVNRGGQVATATRVQLVSMVLEPLTEPHGQPLAEVFANATNMIDLELAGRSPDKTTVTVWVYPDSFGEFRRLKEHLYARGFATAARPLPMNRPIAGGPQGSKSIAQ
ncbi:MAG TPA: hypothetical protein DDZ51_13705 [Planctomycetaceae bacterium]|nr:hypothetical protein [Planctomycetaceae bacterium]